MDNEEIIQHIQNISAESAARAILNTRLENRIKELSAVIQSMQAVLVDKDQVIQRLEHKIEELYQRLRARPNVL